MFAILTTTFFVSSFAYAGWLQFPAYGYSSSSAPVTAVMDHDSSWNNIKTYTGETGSYSDGCRAWVGGQAVACSDSNKSAPWAYKRPGGMTWTMQPNINYNDYTDGTYNKYMWYDNHHGYDYAVQQWTPVVASATGTIHSINYTLGQITMDHGNGYRTIYTHMYLLLPQPQTIQKGSQIGWVSNTGTSGVHLHFVVKRNIGGIWTLVDPYGGSGQPVLWE